MYYEYQKQEQELELAPEPDPSPNPNPAPDPVPHLVQGKDPAGPSCCSSNHPFPLLMLRAKALVDPIFYRSDQRSDIL